MLYGENLTREEIIKQKLIKLNLEEMAEYCDCSIDTMRERIANDEEFPAFRIGKKVYCLLQPFVDYLSQRRI